RCQEWRERVRRGCGQGRQSVCRTAFWPALGPAMLLLWARGAFDGGYGLGGASVPVGAQIWRDVGRRRRTHPQRRGAREARGRLRPRLRRGGFGHGWPDQSARLLGGGCL